MKLIALAAVSGLVAVLAACTGETPAEYTAGAPEEAAEYSTPEASNVLENAAEQVREQNISDPAAAQRALDAAGNAQASPPPSGNGQ